MTRQPVGSPRHRLVIGSGGREFVCSGFSPVSSQTDVRLCAHVAG